MPRLSSTGGKTVRDQRSKRSLNTTLESLLNLDTDMFSGIEPMPSSEKGPSPAFNKISEVTELFELVLLHVDNKTLLLGQRVSRAWKDVIAGSIQLQEKLFFRQPREDPEKDKRDRESGMNPLLPWSRPTAWNRPRGDLARRLGFFLNYRRVANPASQKDPKKTWYVQFDMEFPERSDPRQWTNTGSWQRMYLLRAGHFVERVGLYFLKKSVWKGSATPLHEEGPFTLHGENIVMGELFENARESVKTWRRKYWGPG